MSSLDVPLALTKPIPSKTRPELFPSKRTVMGAWGGFPRGGMGDDEKEGEEDRGRKGGSWCGGVHPTPGLYDTKPWEKAGALWERPLFGRFGRTRRGLSKSLPYEARGRV
jgi:hypothetical protein